MTYNHHDTIYYKAARKLLHHGSRILSPEKIRPLRSVLPFMAEITNDQVGFDLGPDEESEQEVIAEDETENQQLTEKPKPKEARKIPE